MATEFLLPDIGEGLTEAQIIRWMVGVGERVDLDQPLVEVETAKAVVEIPAPRAGVILFHGGAEGDTVTVGSVLAVIGDPGEVWPPADGEIPAGMATADPPLVGTLSDVGEELPARAASGETVQTGRIQALPIVRKLAREAGVELTQVPGTGPGGRVTRDDLEAFLAAGPAAEAPAGATPTPAVTPDRSGRGERLRMSMLRRTIAEHMARSWAEIPHVTTFDEVDATRLLEVRHALATRHDEVIPLEALVAKAVIPAVQDFPFFNASLDGDEIILHASVHLGIAVDTNDGLLVPVIRKAESASVLELAASVVDLGERGRSRTLQPDELSGGTFTISNIGAVGGGFGTPIIPYGTTAILSIGRAADKPIARDGRVEIAPMMPLSLSFDHRVIDGATGRRFMAVVVENLAQPALFLA